MSLRYQIGRAWSGWRRAGWPERRVAVRAAILTVVVKVTLRRRGLARTQGSLRRVPLGGGGGVDPLRTTAIVEAVIRRLGGDATCLQRSLVLVQLLERDGIGAELRIGARRDERATAFHAWVVHDGAVLNDSPEEIARYVVFDPESLRSAELS